MDEIAGELVGGAAAGAGGTVIAGVSVVWVCTGLAVVGVVGIGAYFAYQAYKQPSTTPSTSSGIGENNIHEYIREARDARQQATDRAGQVEVNTQAVAGLAQQREENIRAEEKYKPEQGGYTEEDKKEAKQFVATDGPEGTDPVLDINDENYYAIAEKFIKDDSSSDDEIDSPTLRRAGR